MDCVCFRRFCPLEEDRIVLSIADDDGLSGDEVSPRCDLFEISDRFDLFDDIESVVEIHQ